MRPGIQIALLGFGRMGRIYARTVASRVANAHILAVADPNIATMSADLASFDIPLVLEDAAEAISIPEIQAVVIATPTSTHSALVQMAAAAGKAIFCEKPLALTLEDTRAAIEAVERADVPLQVGFMRRFDAAYVQAKAMIDDGRIGTPVTFKSVGRDPFCPDPAFADPARSGGLIMDMGIHDMDLARWLMGSEVARVSATATQMVCETLRSVGDVDNAVVNLDFESGAIGNVEVSRNAFYGYDIRTEVLGSEGAVQIGSHAHTPVLLLTRDGARHDLIPYLMERFGPAYEAQLVAFIECLQTSRHPEVTGADALAAFEIVLAATYAARGGLAVQVESVRAGWSPAADGQQLQPPSSDVHHAV